MKRLPFISVVLLLFIFSCSRRNESFELEKKGIEFLKHEKYDSAKIYFSRSIEMDSTHTSAYGNLIVVLSALHDTNDIIPTAEKLLRNNPKFAEGWVLTAGIYKVKNPIVSLNYYKKAIELFDERILFSTDTRKISSNKVSKAFCLIKSGKEIEGRKLLMNLLIERSPDSSTINYLLTTNKDSLYN